MRPSSRLSSEDGRRPALHKKAGGLLAVRRYAEAVCEAGRLPNAAHAAADTVCVHLRHSAVKTRKVLAKKCRLINLLAIT
jgi:hypothetical protein